MIRNVQALVCRMLKTGVRFVKPLSHSEVPNATRTLIWSKIDPWFFSIKLRVPSRDKLFAKIHETNCLRKFVASRPQTVWALSVGVHRETNCSRKFVANLVCKQFDHWTAGSSTRQTVCENSSPVGQQTVWALICGSFARQTVCENSSPVKQFEHWIAGYLTRQTVRENSSPVGQQTVWALNCGVLHETNCLRKFVVSWPTNSLSIELRGPSRDKLFAKIRRLSASRQFEHWISGSSTRQAVCENSSPVARQTVCAYNCGVLRETNCCEYSSPVKQFEHWIAGSLTRQTVCENSSPVGQQTVWALNGGVHETNCSRKFVANLVCKQFDHWTAGSSTRQTAYCLRKFVASLPANSLSVELRDPSREKLFAKIRRQSNSLSTELRGTSRDKLFAKIRHQSASKQFEHWIAGSFARRTLILQSVIVS